MKSKFASFALFLFLVLAMFAPSGSFFEFDGSTQKGYPNAYAK